MLLSGPGLGSATHREELRIGKKLKKLLSVWLLQKKLDLNIKLNNC